MSDPFSVGDPAPAPVAAPDLPGAGQQSSAASSGAVSIDLKPQPDASLPSQGEVITDVLATAGDLAAAPSLAGAVTIAEADWQKYHLSRCLRALVVVAVAAFAKDHAGQIPNTEAASIANSTLGAVMYAAIAFAGLYRVLATKKLK